MASVRLALQVPGFQSTSGRPRGGSRYRCESCCSSTFRPHKPRMPRRLLLRRKDLAPAAEVAEVAEAVEELVRQRELVKVMG
jgi:hypothetical protein